MGGLKRLFNTETITVVRPTRVEELGSVYESWDTPATHTVAGCAIQGGDSTEEHDREDAVVAAFTVWAPLGADIVAADRVRFTYGGRSYENFEVLGDPAPLVDPTGMGLSHQVVRLSKREG